MSEIYLHNKRFLLQTDLGEDIFNLDPPNSPIKTFPKTLPIIIISIFLGITIGIIFVVAFKNKNSKKLI